MEGEYADEAGEGSPTMMHWLGYWSKGGEGREEERTGGRERERGGEEGKGD